MKRNETLLDRHCAALVVVDFQEKLAPAIGGGEAVEARIVKLIRMAKLLDIPVLATEQYPKGLGALTRAVKDELDGAEIVEKTAFSCCGSEAFWDRLMALERRQLLVAGAEAHVCVLQTVLDLIANGYQAHVPYDAVGSRTRENYLSAITRMREAGAVITNFESALFEALVRAGTDEFREARKLLD